MPRSTVELVRLFPCQDVEVFLDDFGNSSIGSFDVCLCPCGRVPCLRFLQRVSTLSHWTAVLIQPLSDGLVDWAAASFQ